MLGYSSMTRLFPCYDVVCPARTFAVKSMEVVMDIKELIEFEKMTKLELSQIEREEFLARINILLEQFEKLSAVDTKKAEPLVFVSENQKNVIREDKAQKAFSRDELLKNSHDACDGYFVVPKTIK